MMCNDVGLEAKTSNEGTQLTLKMKHGSQTIAINLFNSANTRPLPAVEDSSSQFKQLQDVIGGYTNRTAAKNFTIEPLEFLHFLQQRRQQHGAGSCRLSSQLCITFSGRGAIQPKATLEWNCGDYTRKITSNGEMSLTIEKDGMSYEINLNGNEENCTDQ